MITAGFSLLYLLGGILLLRRHKNTKRSAGAGPLYLTREILLQDLTAAFLHQLAFALLGLSVGGLFLLKNPWIYLAISLTLIFLVACAHAEALLNFRAVRAGRYAVQKGRANVAFRRGTSKMREEHIISFRNRGDLGSFTLEAFPNYGLEFYNPGDWYDLIVVNGRIARIYAQKTTRLDPALSKE